MTGAQEHTMPLNKPDTEKGVKDGTFYVACILPQSKHHKTKARTEQASDTGVLVGNSLSADLKSSSGKCQIYSKGCLLRRRENTGFSCPKMHLNQHFLLKYT